MNPELPQKPQDDLEARLTALLLGELPHEQAAALHQKLAQDAELAKLYERLKQTINLVRETISSPAKQTADQPTAPKLSEQRRQKLLQQFKTVAPKEFLQPRRRAMPWLVPVGIAAALVVILGGLLLPALSKAKSRGPSLAFGTWSLSKEAEPASATPSATLVPEPAKKEMRLALARPDRDESAKRLPSQAGEVKLVRELSSASSAIVLPQSGEPTGVAPTSPVAEDRQAGFGVSANIRGFYDDSLGRAGGAGRGGAFGGFASSARGDVSATEGRQAGTAATDSFFSQPEGKDTLASGTPAEVRGRLQAIGKSSSPPAVAGDSIVTLGLKAGHPVEAPAPAVVPPPVASAPAAAAGFSLLGPAPALTPAAPADGVEVAGVRLQAPGADKNNGLIPAQKGTAPSAQAGNSAGTSDFSVAAAGGQNLNYQWGYDASAEAGQAHSDGDKLPILGDVPAAGRYFRTTSKAAGGRAKAETAGALRAQVEERVKSMELADYAGERQKSDAEGQAGRALNRDANVYSLDVVGYVNRSLTVTNSIAVVPTEPSTVERYAGYRQLSQLGADTDRASGVAKSPIVLPPELAPGLALKTGPNKDVQLFASANQPASAPAILDGTQKQAGEDAAKTRPYFEAKRQLEELQRFRQVLDAKIASEKIDMTLPKTTMVEITDKAVPASAPSSTLWDKIRGKSGEFKSTARIKVERDQSDIAGLADAQKVTGYDPYFVQTEFETIQSEAILGKVIKDLNLNEAWGKKQGGRTLTTAETMALLKNKLDLRPEQNTSLIDIGVKSDKPEEAARIANAVAEAYRAHYTEQRAQLSKGSITALEERYTEQEQKVREAQKKADDLRAKLQISDGAAQGQAADVTASKTTAPAPIPQPEVQTAENAFSTFSLNVSDVSFKLAAASLEKGVMPEPATVRSEEFINAFDYRDPEPPPGVPVAFAWERAQYPFAQNRDLLRFSIKTAALGRQPGRPLNLVLLLDNSGSMERADRVRIIREALRVLAEQLQPQDKLSVITFARTPRLFADGAPGSDAGAIAMALTELTPQGGTNLEDAMNLAYQTALRHYLANGVNRVVLLTDGAANLGSVDPEALKQKVEANRKQGIALDCFGIGWEGYNDDLLEVLSRNGDGRYGFVNTPEEAATDFAGQLAGALHVAASDVKVQVEFNPARVTAYRQIGYAKHQLTKQQFRDNTVDAAETAAQEAGNALYVVEVNPRGDGPLGTVRVRYKVPGTSDYHEHEWPVPYTGNAVALEQASPGMRLAATASALSEWLVSSPYAGEVTPDRLLGYLSGVPEVYGADARPKKLEWMIRQAKSIAGK